MRITQYTIRNVPDPTDRALRLRAKKQGKSFNQTLLDALSQAAGVTNKNKPQPHNDLDWFIGNKTIEKKGFNKSQEWLDNLPIDAP